MNGACCTNAEPEQRAKIGRKELMAQAKRCEVVALEWQVAGLPVTRPQCKAESGAAMTPARFMLRTAEAVRVLVF